MSLIFIIILLLYCNHLGKKYGNRDTVSGLGNNSVWSAKIIWKHPIAYHIGYMLANIVRGFVILIKILFKFIINVCKNGWPYIQKLLGDMMIRLNRK